MPKNRLAQPSKKSPPAPSTAPKDPHDQEFFEQMRGCRDNYRKLGDAIDAILRQPYTAYDIGCGIGLQTARLQEHGWPASGLEFAPAAIDLIEPGVMVEKFDLTKAKGGNPRALPKRACVICTETAEHIPAKFADRIVENVASLATDVIVWSAAAPGQEWHGHINLQRPEYWLKRFEEHGWVLDVARTGALRDEMIRTEAQHWMGKENFCILVPKEKHKPLHFTITSTVFNAQQYIERHIQSVARQTYPHYKHVIVDAVSTDLTYPFARSAQAVIDSHGEKFPTITRLSEHRKILQNPKGARKGPLENALSIWRTLPDDEVIVWLDGDDWLAVDNALDIVARTYASPIDPWTTYGQFMFASGELGFAGPYQPGQNARDSDWWRATHLKTFRAGLVKSIDPALLKDPSGAFCSLAIDRAVMYPLLELAGEHQAFIDKILYVYNSKASWWANQPESERQRELDEVARMRALPRLSPLGKQPW